MFPQQSHLLPCKEPHEPPKTTGLVFGTWSKPPVNSRPVPWDPLRACTSPCFLGFPAWYSGPASYGCGRNRCQEVHVSQHVSGQKNGSKPEKENQRWGRTGSCRLVVVLPSRQFQEVFGNMNQSHSLGLAYYQQQWMMMVRLQVLL